MENAHSAQPLIGMKGWLIIATIYSSEPSKESPHKTTVGDLVYQLKTGKLFGNEVRILDEEGNEYEPVLVEIEDDISYIKVQLCNFL